MNDDDRVYTEDEIDEKPDDGAQDVTDEEGDA